MKILQINGSARREGANSTRVADAIVARLKAKNPAATVVRRDLASNPCPLLYEAALGALFTPADQRSPEQVARVASARSLSEETIRALVEAQTQPRLWGLIGEPRVNVLALNLSLDRLTP